MNALIILLGLLLITLVFLSEGAKKHWALDLLNHFRVYYLIGLLGCGIYFSTFNTYYLFPVLTAFLLNLFRMLPSESGYIKRRSFITKEKFKLLSFNVLHSNRNFKKLNEYIQKENPDFISLYETGKAWEKELIELQKIYPFSYLSFAESSFGQAFFSKYPFNISEQGLRDKTTPYFLMELVLKGSRLQMIAAHPQSPLTKKRSEHRNRQFEEMGRVLSHLQGSKILVGDLNNTPFSPYFKDLCKKANLENNGFKSTWPAPFAPLGIPIDHFLYTPDVVVHEKKRAPNLGSDHYPLVITFSLL
jgi:endonuclease/exonuclease/phosphatase (EEP) superfamily protein YafD